MNWYYLRDDGGQFGPMAWADLWQCGQTGQLRPTDLVWREGMPEWRTAASVPGLFPAPQPAPAPVPVPQGPSAAPVPQSAPQPQAAGPHWQASQPQYAQSPRYPVAAQPTGDEKLMRMLLPVGRSMWAIMAGYFGLLSLLGIFAPLALVTGIVAVIDIKRNPNKHGMGRAIFGIVMGAIFSIVLAIALAAWVMEKS